MKGFHKYDIAMLIVYAVVFLLSIATSVTFIWGIIKVTRLLIECVR